MRGFSSNWNDFSPGRNVGEDWKLSGFGKEMAEASENRLVSIGLTVNSWRIDGREDSRRF